MRKNSIESPDGVLRPYQWGAGYTVHPSGAGLSGAQALGQGYVFTKAAGLSALAVMRGMPSRRGGESVDHYRQRVLDHARAAGNEPLVGLVSKLLSKGPTSL